MLRLLPDNIEDYALQHTTPLPPLLEELMATTRERMGRRAGMLSGPVEGALLQMLIATIGARRILELGTFTGFSALVMAAALPDDGQLITCDVDPEATAIAREYWARSPDGHKIELRLGPALETIKTLQGPFDLVFVDADKPSYRAYYEELLPRLRPNGLVLFDNVLWSGAVADASDHSENTEAIRALNDHVARDARVESVMLPIADGLTIVRKR